MLLFELGEVPLLDIINQTEKDIVVLNGLYENLLYYELFLSNFTFKTIFGFKNCNIKRIIFVL